jgi:hypothetical protein
MFCTGKRRLLYHVKIHNINNHFSVASGVGELANFNRETRLTGEKKKRNEFALKRTLKS